MKTYQKFLILRSIFKILQKKCSKTSKNIEKIHMDFEESTNLLRKKNRQPDYLLDNYFFANSLISFRNYYYAK